MSRKDNGEKQPGVIKGFSGLQGMQFGPRQQKPERLKVDPGTQPRPAINVRARRISAPVTKPERGGRAPYNFVPLADQWRALTKDEEPPRGDSYGVGLLSGEIELRLTALTDFYVRGMWSLGTGRAVREQSQPFLVNNQLRLPGSSLRGMIRTLVEIFGEAPLDPVNDQQLFFRAVAATSNPADRGSFEPQAKAYKDQLGPAAENVRPGYLYVRTDGWKIRPAKLLPDGAKWLRIRTSLVWSRGQRVWFRPLNERFGTRCAPPAAGSKDDWPVEGYLICSGKIPPRRGQGRREDKPERAQWLIPLEDPGAPMVEIPEDDVVAYKEAGITQEIRKNRFDYREGSEPAPCFWVQWKDSLGTAHVSFGHTPFFRVPYVHTTRAAIPPQNRREKNDPRWDLAQAIFGRVSESDAVPGAKGRVHFEDAVLVTGGSWEQQPAKVVLGGPKPTTYQHYLVQPSDLVSESIAWDGDFKNTRGVDPVVRGHKLYWHRPNAPIRPAEADQEKVATSLQVAHKGAVFSARIRYENLREHELGALLMALQLPEGCAHRLGMGKPLGLGSFRIEVKAVREIDRRDKRYRSFFESSKGVELPIATGTLPADDNAVAKYQRSFARWYLKPHGREGAPDLVGTLWTDPRMQELRALLRFDGLPGDWADRTRYLEFGRLRGGGLYNEYQHVGYPNRDLQKRRPLAPATQVLGGGSPIPNDPRPPFEGPDPVPDLRARKPPLVRD